MLYYVTGNSIKIGNTKMHLSKYRIAFAPVKLALIEMQSESVEEIARSKAEQIFSRGGTESQRRRKNVERISRMVSALLQSFEEVIDAAGPAAVR